MEAPQHVRDALLTIQLEYVEMPHLKLTAPQVQRLWSLPTDVCEAVLTLLIRKGFLTQTSDGVYVRHCVTRERLEPISALVRAS